jgi:hypothetical protein
MTEFERIEAKLEHTDAVLIELLRQVERLADATTMLGNVLGNVLQAQQREPLAGRRLPTQGQQQ